MGVLTGRRERRQWAPEPVIAPYPGVNMFGGPSSLAKPEQALIVPAVWACVNLLSSAVSMLPLETYRRTSGVPARITDPMLVTNPSADMTQSEWLHMLMVSLLLRGNAYGLKTGLDTGVRPTQLVLLNPDKVRMRDDGNGGVRYFVGPNQTDVTARMWHVRGMTLPGTSVGLSPIEYAATAIGVDLASRKFARDFFDGGGIPKATLSSDQMLTQEQADTAKQRLQVATANREPAVFGAGIKYQPISVRPNESQFLETQAANISEIARFFGIPAEMVGGKTGSSLTYTNVEQRSLDFLTYGVSFWLKRIEDAFFGLLPQPQFVRFNAAALLRADAQTQAEVDVLNVAGKIRPPSEIRTEHNWAPLTTAQKAELELIPLTVQPTGRPKSLPAPPTPTTSPDTPVVGPVPATPKPGEANV